MINKKRFIRISAFIFIVSVLAVSFYGCGGGKNFATGASSGTIKNLAAASTWEISETTHLTVLTIADGASIKVPEGYSLTMTVDGVETGQKLVDLNAADGATQIIPGSYKGNIVLTVTKANPTKSFKLRQALYLDKTGVVADKSVLAAVAGKRFAGFEIRDIKIRSTGECFNGIYVTGGKYTFNNLKIDFTGDGRSDFEGYGAAIMASGNDTRLVVDNSIIQNRGIVRTGVVAADGSIWRLAA